MERSRRGRESFSRFEKFKFGGGALILVEICPARGEALGEIFRRRGFVAVKEVFRANVEPGFAELSSFDICVAIFGVFE